MTLIALKFSPDMEDAIISGKKCCTTRDEVKGNPGDMFVVRDRLYQIVDVLPVHVSGEFLRGNFRIEGFKTSFNFTDTLSEIYPNLKFGDLVYVHFFAYVGEYH